MNDEPAPPAGWPEPQSAYVHVPFCRHRCGYCNFTVLADRADLYGEFLDAIQRELEQLQQPQQVRTLFLGGGTPTQLPPAHLNRLFDLLEHWLPLAPGGELSVEANPEDITPRCIDQLCSRGVNRVSLGVQSFSEKKLALLQRGHDALAASRAVQLAADAIGNVSIDLIFAAPGETPRDWQADLQQAMQLPITHLSTYCLTYEKGTQFWNNRRRGELLEVSEADELQMYQDARQVAAAHGLEQYEISSFARSGFRCEHNLSYWHGRAWYAFGPGAARFVGGRREVNHRSATTYIRRMLSGQSPVAECETITPQQWACERAAFGVRMIDGVDFAIIHRETGVDIARLRGEQIARCVARGWLQVCGSHYRLSEAGIVMADSVAAELL